MSVLVSAETAAPGGKGGRRALGSRARKIAAAALEAAGASDRELSVLLTGDARVRELNRDYRGIDRTTDVLSFPLGDDDGEDGGMLGDVVISVEKAARQAGEFGVGFDAELARLLVHGILHLLGYDHTAGGWQARRMKAREGEILETIKEKGFAD